MAKVGFSRFYDLGDVSGSTTVVIEPTQAAGGAALTAQRLAWLTLRKYRGEAITYTRGDLIISGLVAVPTRPDAVQIDAGDGLGISSRNLDFLIDPAELIDETLAQVEPRQGDRITRANGDVFRVQATNGQDDPWHWSDPLETWRRINSNKQS